MSILVAFLLLAAFVGWMVVSGARYQQRHRDWPRGRIATIVGFAYSMGLWPWQDQFGLKPDPTFLPPDTPVVAIRLEELQRQETARVVEEKTAVQEMLGG